MERTRDEGIDFVGPDGLMTGLTRNVLEAGLEAEMSEHLGDDEHEPTRPESGSNSRNGTRSKTVLTDVGPVQIEMPRDRDGRFEPQPVKKRQRRLAGVDEMMISLTAKVHRRTWLRSTAPTSRGTRNRGSPIGSWRRFPVGRTVRWIACVRWCSSTRSSSRSEMAGHELACLHRNQRAGGQSALQRLG